MSVGKNKNKHRETPAARKEIGFTKGDIIAAQKGSTNAWHRIRSYFMPRIRYLVYQHRPGHTAQDYRDDASRAESALLEAVMTFKIRGIEKKRG